ncbi:MAG: hypothetical protein JJU20_11555 [Opitutales bacterium]|nr:hypothetical protein [Opitutales bacterium]
MKLYYYFSLIPESLIVSMLDPESFGNYFAIGSQKRSRGQAIFFEVDPDKLPDSRWLHEAARKCVPHEDGAPRKSTYLRIYRVLESLPLSALKRLYLATSDGRVLGLDSAEHAVEANRPVHLYQELCPVSPRVVSTLNPVAFGRQITDPTESVWVPKIVFAELKLEELALNPETAKADNLPYPNIEHLRDCIKELKNRYSKPNKMVIRQVREEVLYRTIRSGFFVAEPNGMLYYPFPDKSDLETIHYTWWHSALSSLGA